MTLFFFNNILFDYRKYKLICTDFSFNDWISYANIITLSLILTFVIILGIVLKNNAKHVKVYNIICFYYLMIFFLSTSFSFTYDETYPLNATQYDTALVNLFTFLIIIASMVFFLGISDEHYIEENTKMEYSMLVWFIIISSIGLISSKDFITIIILLECISFSSYILVGFDRKNKNSSTSALKYLILASVPSGFLILGISLLYNFYGTFSQDFIFLLNKSLFEKLDLIGLWVSLNEYFYSNSDFSYYCLNMTEKDVRAAFIAYIENLELVFKLWGPFILKTLFWYEDQAIRIEKVGGFRIFIEEYYYWNDLLDNHKDEEELMKLLEVDIFRISEETLWTLACETNLEQNPYFERYVNVFGQYKIIVQEIFYLTKLLPTYFGVVLPTIPSDYDVFSKPEIFKFFEEHNFTFLNYWLSIYPTFDFFRMQKEFPSDTQEVLTGLFCLPEFQKLNLLKSTHLDIYDAGYLHPSLPAGIDYIAQNFSQRDMKIFLNNNRRVFFEAIYTYSQSELKNQFLTDLMNPSSKFANYTTLIQRHAEIFKNFNYYSMSWATQWSRYVEYLKTPDHFYSTPFIVLYWEKLCDSTNTISLFIIIFFILINIFFKLTASPFHFWAPSVYGGAPLSTLIFLSIFSKLTILFLTISIFWSVFGIISDLWQPIFLLVSLLSVISSILGAFSESIFKRFFIYSSVGHIGFMLLGIGVLNLNGVQGTVDYLIMYIISSFIIWFIILHLTKKTRTLVNLKGVSFNNFFLGFIFSFTIFSLSGIPPLGGFFVKYEIFYSLLNSSLFFFAYILLILTVISFFYYLRIIKIVFFENNKEFSKDRNLSDIKLRIIAICFFWLPFYIWIMETPFVYIIKEILKKTL